MSEILLRGLRAGTPLGFLAALGAFRHAAEMHERLGPVRMRWERGGGEWLACLVTEHQVDEETLLAGYVDRALSLGYRPEFNWADQIKKNTVEDFRKAIVEHETFGDWFAAFGSELALSKDLTLKSTDFDMTGGQQKFLLKLRDGSKSLASSASEAGTLLQEALFGPWMYGVAKRATEAENSHSLGLDPSTLLQGAFTAEEPAGIKDKRGVRGAIWLAFEALPLFPSVVVGGRLTTAGFCRQRVDGGWKGYFEWGVWAQPLSLEALKLLLVLPREEWTRRRGIEERFRSERVNLNKDYYSLAPAELVV